jgi:ligand-binding SRPBCC domain-containing protein
VARLTRSIRIAAPVEAVFAFHADPRNIERLSTPQAQAQLVPPYEVPLRQGSIVRLRVMLLGLVPQQVETEIVVCDPPREFTDQQRRGPFRSWRHRHLFRPVAGGTELTDDVTYELPTGLPFRLIGEAAMMAQMEALFQHRQQRTKEILEGVGC